MNPWLINRSLRQFEESNSIKVVAKAAEIVDSDVSIETRVSYNLQICFMIKSSAERQF